MRRKRRTRSITRGITRSLVNPLSSGIAGVFGRGLSGLLSLYPGAAAGYSLRKIGSGPVVRLRRASDNEEKDFYAGDLTGSVEGSELLPDPSFDDGAQWDTGGGWSVSGGQATATSGSGAGYVSTKNNITPSDWYLVEVDIDSISGSYIQIYVPWSSNFQSRGTISAAGVYEVLCQSDGTTFDFALRAVDATNAVINSVSVKPYTPTAAEIWSITNPGTSTTSHAYATTWYDQSGSGNDATQTTAASQPKLITAGVTELENGKPAMVFDGVDDYIQNTSPSHTVASIVAVWNKGSGNNRVMFDGSTSATGANRIWRDFPNSGTRLLNGASTLQATNSSGTDTQNLTFATNDGAGGGSISDNGETPITGTMGTIAMSAYRLGGGLGGLGFHLSYIQEVIVYASDQSANRIGIEGNINDHYGIY